MDNNKPVFRNTFYKHKKFRDVCVSVEKIQYRGPTYFKAKISWWNLRGYPIGIKATITIKYEDYKDWEPLDDFISFGKGSNNLKNISNIKRRNKVRN